jgi:hypothetical protein
MQQGPELGDKKEFEQVEKDLRRAQASHLVSEQERQVMANAPASVAQTAPSRDERKDQDLVAAEQQAEKLNKAQEVAAAKVLPLRVNLPTHGVRHAFTQVLQTEVGKPMTVQFAATNTRAASWPMRILAGAIALGALWALVSAVLSRRQA